MRETKALASQRICADSPEPPLVGTVISTDLVCWLFSPVHDKTNEMIFASSEDSNQSEHPTEHTRVFTMHLVGYFLMQIAKSLIRLF